MAIIHLAGYDINGVVAGSWAYLGDSAAMEKDEYMRGFVITSIITFFLSYIYCIAAYGFLFGLGLGWLPSIIVAVIAGAIWPLIALVLVVGLIVIIFSVAK